VIVENRSFAFFAIEAMAMASTYGYTPLSFGSSLGLPQFKRATVPNSTKSCIVLGVAFLL
jgi:hypothetical protein